MLGRIELQAVEHALNGRKHERYQVSGIGRLDMIGHKLKSSRSIPCRLNDISAGGAAVEIPPGMTLTDHVYLTLPDHHKAIGAGVAHIRGNQLGLMFLRDLDEDELQTILRLPTVHWHRRAV